MKLNWQFDTADYILGQHEVHLWQASLNCSQNILDFLTRLLSADELERAGKFLQTKHAEQFIIARGMLRLILGRYLQSRPEEILFSYSETGKPKLAQIATTKLNFNLSHSQGYVLYALGQYSELGIDLEYAKDMGNIKEIARRFFNSQDCEYLETYSNEQELFFKLWTAKEAYLKATGQGIAGGLDKVKLTIEQDRFFLERPWTVYSFSPQTRYYAALACKGKLEKILGFSIDLDQFCQELDHSHHYAKDDKRESS